MEILLQDYMYAATSSIGELEWRDKIFKNEEFLTNYFENKKEIVPSIEDLKLFFENEDVKIIEKIRKKHGKIDEIFFANKNQDQEDAFLNKIINNNISETIRNINIVSDIISENILLKYDSIEPFIDSMNETFLPIKKFKIKTADKVTKCKLNGKKVFCESNDKQLLEHFERRNSSRHSKFYYVSSQYEPNLKEAKKDLLFFKNVNIPTNIAYNSLVEGIRIRAYSNQFWSPSPGLFETIDRKEICILNVIKE
jgi:hypothetical protein